MSKQVDNLSNIGAVRIQIAKGAIKKQKAFKIRR